MKCTLVSVWSLDPRRWSLARQALALVAVALVVAVAGGVVAAYLQARSSSYRAARDEVLSVALSVAAAPSVRSAVVGPDPTAVLQPYAEDVEAGTGADFVVIMDPGGVRFTHPDRTQIGGRFLGHTAPALAGRAFTETYTGTLGPSVRAVAPVRGTGGAVTGLVAVGITRQEAGRTVGRQLPALVGAGALALVLGTAGAVLLGRRLRRQTHGMDPQELSRMYEFYDAVLHAVREGLLLLDPSGRLQLVNDEGRRLLGLPPDAVGRPIADLGLPRDLADALADREPRTDDVQLSAERVLVVSSAPARWEGRDLGTVVTLRDHTDLLALSGELDSVRGFTESLRSQAHEAANRLHTVIALIELGRTDRALEFATAELAGVQDLTDRVNWTRSPTRTPRPGAGARTGPGPAGRDPAGRHRGPAPRRARRAVPRRSAAASGGGRVIRVLVVEDDPIALDAHVAYVERVPGFTVAARAGTGTEALRQLAGDGIDLVLLDMNQSAASRRWTGCSGRCRPAATGCPRA